MKRELIVLSVLSALPATMSVLACHQLYAEDKAALDQEVRLSVLAASHQQEGGVGRILDLANVCAARAIQARHRITPTATDPIDAGCPQ